MRGPRKSLIRLHPGLADPAPPGSRWLVNGFPAEVLLWTAGEWARLRSRPQDAQRYPNGCWVALRIG